jgi:hypothetical protein
MMVCPGKRLRARLRDNIIWKLWSKAERVDVVRENMTAWDRSIEEVVKIVDMHIPVAETPSRGDMEISNNLVNSQTPLNTAALLSLRIQSFCIVFTLALLYILASSEGPGHTGIRFSNFVTGITASRFLCVRRWCCTVTATAVIRVKVCCLIIGVPGKN